MRVYLGDLQVDKGDFDISVNKHFTKVAHPHHWRSNTIFVFFLRLQLEALLDQLGFHVIGEFLQMLLQQKLLCVFEPLFAADRRVFQGDVTPDHRHDSDQFILGYSADFVLIVQHAYHVAGIAVLTRAWFQSELLGI